MQSNVLYPIVAYLLVGALMWYAMYETQLRTGRVAPINPEKAFIGIVICAIFWPLVLLYHISNHRG